jgi:hypothetical protein
MFTYSEALYSDMHKDAFGFRPSSDDPFYLAKTPAEKQVIWDSVENAVCDSIDQEKIQNEKKLAQFEATIADIMNASTSYDDAVRIYVDSLALDKESIKFYGASYICYEANLPFSMADIFVNALKIRKE